MSDKVQGFAWQVCVGEGSQVAGVPQLSETGPPLGMCVEFHRALAAVHSSHLEVLPLSSLCVCVCVMCVMYVVCDVRVMCVGDVCVCVCVCVWCLPTPRGTGEKYRSGN